MTNDEFEIVVRTRLGSTQRFYRDPEGWVQIASTGVSHRLTAEQVLNHLLPAMLNESSLAAYVTKRQK